MAENRHREVDLRIDLRELAGGNELMPAPERAGGNQEQAEHKNARHDQEYDQADIRINCAADECFKEPESDESERGTGGDDSTNQGERIRAEVNSGAEGLADAVAKTHGLNGVKNPGRMVERGRRFFTPVKIVQPYFFLAISRMAATTCLIWSSVSLPL